MSTASPAKPLVRSAAWAVMPWPASLRLKASMWVMRPSQRYRSSRVSWMVRLLRLRVKREPECMPASRASRAGGSTWSSGGMPSSCGTVGSCRPGLQQGCRKRAMIASRPRLSILLAQAANSRSRRAGSSGWARWIRSTSASSSPRYASWMLLARCRSDGWPVPTERRKSASVSSRLLTPSSPSSNGRWRRLNSSSAAST